MVFDQNLDEACKNLPRVLKVLTKLSLQSTATLLPQDERADSLLADYDKHLENLSAMIQLDEGKLNPRWNRVYGDGETEWSGSVSDGKTRGGIPYYCPRGWIRFSLNVCPDEEFERRFGSWGYLYHGTNSKHVGSILMSGFRASKNLCYCGINDSAVYMSPSIEYCGHPRYGCIEYNPETRKWLQMVLQCRVNPAAVWQKQPETMRCKEFGIKAIDPNFSNDVMEWLFRPEAKIGDAFYVKDAIVCTGIMLRISDSHPCELRHWWSRDSKYLQAWSLNYPIVDPAKPLDSEWVVMKETELEEFSSTGNCLGGDFTLKGKKRQLGQSRMAPRPFGRGGMCFAYFLETDQGMFVVKRYNTETLKHISDALRISQEEAIHKEVTTYLIAEDFAKKFNDAMPEQHQHSSNYIRFLEPYIFRLRDSGGTQHVLFGERYVEGNFIKWNSNAGYVNTGIEAEEARMHQVVGVFAHHTFHASKGHLMVVDIQGWQLGVVGNRHILFTDPQIHTRQKHASRFTDPLYRRFSLGNLGRTGMMRFFKTHKCTVYCHKMGLTAPEKSMEALRNAQGDCPSGDDVDLLVPVKADSMIPYTAHNVLPGQKRHPRPARQLLPDLPESDESDQWQPSCPPAPSTPSRISWLAWMVSFCCSDLFPRSRHPDEDL